MKRNSSKDTFRMELLPTEEEVDSFDPRTRECCTADDFRPNLRKSPKSPWNRSAARVFARHMNESQRYRFWEAGLIIEQFHNHLKQLQKMFKLMNMELEVKEAEARRRRRDRRKYLVSLLTCESHCNLLTKYGTDSF